MGVVRMRVWTADKKHHNNPQVIHMTPVHQLMSCEVKSYMFVWWILAKIPYSIIILPPVKKSIPCCLLTSKSTEIFVKNCFWLFFSFVNRAWSVHISLLIQKSNIMDRGLVAYFIVWSQKYLDEWWISFLQTHSFLLHKTLIDGLESWGLLVDYSDVLSAVWTLVLMALIHCRWSIG